MDQTMAAGTELPAQAVTGAEPTSAVTPEHKRSDPDLLAWKLAYTIPEAGLLIGLCRASVYKLIADGQLSTVNLAERAPRILREELQAFLQRKAAAVQARREAVAATLGTSARRWR